MLADVGLLEEGDAAEEDGVTGALKTARDGKKLPLPLPLLLLYYHCKITLYFIYLLSFFN